MPFPIEVTVRVRSRLSKTAGIALRAARERMNRKAAEMLAAATRSNFGPVDQGYRPFSWEPYKRNYGPGKRKGDPATLIGANRKTGARTGVLLASIKVSATNSWGQVSAQGSRNYAFAHQFGNPGRGLPARPYFPVYRTPSGFVLVPRLEKEITDALEKEAAAIINRG